MATFLEAMTEKVEKLKTDPEGRKWKGDFTFIQGADCQFGLIDRYMLKKEIPNWDKEIKLSEAAIRQINAMRPKPKFFVICGDMLDAFPTEGEQRNIREQQLVDFRKVYSKVDPDIPLVCVCGNHDIGDIPTKENLKVYREQFGQDYFVFWTGGVRFVVLNSQYYMNSDDVKEELDKQNALIDSLNTENRAVHTVVFQHIPYFLNDPEEADDGYFNIEKTTRIQILDKLIKAGVKYVFTGHYHRNAGGTYKDIEEVVTCAIGAPLGKDPSGFRIVSVTDKAISHEYVLVNETVALS